MLLQIIKNLFLLFIFLLPWQTRWIYDQGFLNGFTWEFGTLSLYGTEILLWIILLLYFFWLVKDRKLKAFSFQKALSQIKKPKFLTYWVLVLFVLFSGLTIFWSFNSYLTYHRWFRLLEVTALLAMILNLDIKIKKISIALVASAAIQGVFAIWQFFAQYVPANKWFGLAFHHPNLGGSIILQTEIERWMRAYGSLPHPNILGGFLVIAVLLILYLSFISKQRSERIFIVTSLLCIVPSLFFTFSRSAWVALIFCLLFLTAWLFKKKEYLLNQMFGKMMIFTLIMIAVLSVSLYGPLEARIRGEQDLEVASIYLRVEFTKQAMTIFQNAPAVGVGIGNYTLGVYNYVNGGWPGYYYQPVHNIYLLVLSETGLIGASLFYLFLLMLLYFGYKNIKKLEGIILFLALLSILIISLFDHYYLTTYFGLVLFAVIASLNLKRF